MSFLLVSKFFFGRMKPFNIINIIIIIIITLVINARNSSSNNSSIIISSSSGMWARRIKEFSSQRKIIRSVGFNPFVLVCISVL